MGESFYSYIFEMMGEWGPGHSGKAARALSTANLSTITVGEAEHTVASAGG